MIDCGPCNLGIKICTNSYNCNITGNGSPTTTIQKGVPYPVNCDPKNPTYCKPKGKGKGKSRGALGRDLALELGSPFPLDSGSGDDCGGGSTGGSIDPNYKSGPVGDGSTAQYVRSNVALSYSVGFENEPTASLPAAQVVVTDQLDPSKVDLSTLTLGTVSFGANVINLPGGTSNYSTTYKLNSSLSVRIQGSLDSSTGLLKWTFTSIDPSTGVPPTDPTIGFLPPDKDGIVGQGSVLFNVSPKPGLTTGTLITNYATVVFDSNAAIKTPTWSNTLDADAPASKVAALPSVESTTAATLAFPVKWSGSDKGSGIKSYDVYVSDNEGSFTLWQSAVTTTTANYTGTLGHAYGFYSIATDGAGNVEASKNSPDTTTTVGTPAPLVSTTTLSASSTSVASGASVTLTAQVTAPAGSTAIPTGKVTFLNGTTSLGTGDLDGTGKASFTTTALPVGVDSITAHYGGDVVFATSTSAAVAVTVGTPAFSLALSPASVSVSSGSSVQHSPARDCLRTRPAPSRPPH
jgi:hypothetical protein